MTEEEIKGLTLKAFAYYNGRINPNNLVRLEMSDINMSRNGQPVNGCFEYPNIVTIFTKSILYRNNYDDSRKRFSIIETIIHELYHAEQACMYNKNTEMSKIEGDVDFMTTSYILNNERELFTLFGINFLYIYNDTMIPVNNTLYQRNNYFSHICDFIHLAMRLSKKYGTIEAINTVIERCMRCLNKKYSDVEFSINGNKIIIKKARYLIGIDAFNQQIYEFFCKYNMFDNLEIAVYVDEEDAYFDMEIKCERYIIMASIANKGE